MSNRVSVFDLIDLPVAGIRAQVTGERCCGGAPLVRTLVSVTRKRRKGTAWIYVHWKPEGEKIPGCVHGVDIVDCGYSGMTEDHAKQVDWSLVMNVKEAACV